jgi:hypothetical protein
MSGQLGVKVLLGVQAVLLVVTGWIVVGYRVDLQHAQQSLDETMKVVTDTRLEVQRVSLQVSFLQLVTGPTGVADDLGMEKLAEVVGVMRRWTAIADTIRNP